MTQHDFGALLQALEDTGIVKVVQGYDGGAMTPAPPIDFLVEEDGPGSPSATNMEKVIEVLDRFHISRESESDDRVVAQTGAQGDVRVRLVFTRSHDM